jgi:hypothetical protein
MKRAPAKGEGQSLGSQMHATTLNENSKRSVTGPQNHASQAVWRTDAGGIRHVGNPQNPDRAGRCSGSHPAKKNASASTVRGAVRL